MGIFDRLSSLLRSNINDLISRAEDPEKMLTQILVDMRGQLAKAKQQEKKKDGKWPNYGAIEIHSLNL